MTDTRQVIEGKQLQGVEESVAYTVTTTPWGSTPTSIVVAAYDVTGGGRVDVSATVLDGTASATGDVITLPNLEALTEGHLYRVECKFTSAGNVFEVYMLVEAEL